MTESKQSARSVNPKLLEGWRRALWDPEQEYTHIENVHFWPGPGPCVDGYFYWQYKQWAKRLELQEWINRGKRKRRPVEKGDRPSMRLEDFELS